MSEVKDPTMKCLYNDLLREVFQELHSTVVDTVNVAAVIDRLFSAKVIGASDLHDLQQITDRLEKCRSLLALLHKSKHPSSFVDLRRAIQYEAAHEWLIARIDLRHETLKSSAKSSEVQKTSESPQTNAPATNSDGVFSAGLWAGYDEMLGEISQLKHQIERLEGEKLSLERELERYRHSANDGTRRYHHSQGQLDPRNRTRRIVADRNRMIHTEEPYRMRLESANIDGFVITFEGTSEAAVSDHRTTRGDLMEHFESTIEDDEETQGFALDYREDSESFSSVRFDDGVQHRVDSFLRETVHETVPVARVRAAEAKRPDNNGCKLIRTANGSREKPFCTGKKSQSRAGMNPVEPKAIISAGGKGSSVRALTTLGNRLFVIQWPSGQLVDVYDVLTMSPQSSISVPRLGSGPHTMASCSINCCVYIIDGCTGSVYRIDAFDCVTSWQLDGSPSGLSVNADENVIVTMRGSRSNPGDRLLEMTTNGSLIREIRLQPHIADVGHAIQLSHDVFVVSHTVYGNSRLRLSTILASRSSFFGAFGQVAEATILDSCLLKTRGAATVRPATAGSNADCSFVHLAVDKSGNIVVGDRDADEILVLDANLSRVRVLPVSVDGGLQGPAAVHLDESRGRLYVGESRGGRILVFDNVSVVSTLVIDG